MPGSHADLHLLAFSRSSKISLVLGWIVFVILAYRVSLIEIEHKEYDPFAVLNVDRVGDLSTLASLVQCSSHGRMHVLV